MVRFILITRPQPAAGKFADDLRARLGENAEIVVAPLLEIEYLPGPEADTAGLGALVLTSAHAVPAAVRLRPLPCYCVGPATARAAREAGLSAIDGGGTAAALAERIRADAPAGPLLYLRGAHVACDLAKTLSIAGIETHQAVVYRQNPRPLAGAATALLHGEAPTILPLFSPRSARLLFAEARPTAPVLIAAISRKVADCVPPGLTQNLVVAKAPTAGAMLDAVDALWSRARRVVSGKRAK